MHPPSAQTSQGLEQRRSRRVLLSLPVLVQGEEDGTHSVLEGAQALMANAHGALITLTMRVQLGQLLLLKNQESQEEQPCKVVYLGTTLNGKTPVGVEFTRPAPRFWRIAFPPDDWKPYSSACGIAGFA